MTLTLCMKIAYGVGHVLNDLCASMWFTYTLVFYNLVVGFSSVNAGGIVLVGQIADALATPTVGFLSDRGKLLWALRYGKRKTWHLIGTICVLGSTPFMYSPCINCEKSKAWIQIIYYSIFVAVFQFGWASVQISHLSLVPDLTPDEHERTSLLSIRYSFTVLSNLAVYLVMWGVLEITSSSANTQLSSSDMIKFQEISYVICGAGVVTSVLFHVIVKESTDDPLLGSESTNQTRASIRSLLKNRELYLIAIVYMFTRLFCNISQSMIPLYLHEVLHLGAQSLAIVPFVMFLSSFLTSLITRPMNSRLGRKFTFTIGGVIGVGASIWIYFGQGHVYVTYCVFVIAAIIGCASSILLVTSLAITADLIGNDVGNGALVYGIMSFVDKLSSGIVIMVIQTIKPDGPSNFYRNVLAGACGVSALLGVVFVFTLVKNDKRSEDEGDDNPAPQIAQIS